MLSGTSSRECLVSAMESAARAADNNVALAQA